MNTLYVVIKKVLGCFRNKNNIYPVGKAARVNINDKDFSQAH